MSLGQAAQGFADALLEDDPVALYDRAPCGYLSTLADGSVVKVNSTFLTLTGYSRNEVLSARLIDFLTPGGRLFHETRLAPLLQLQDSVREVALDIVRKDGTRLPVLLNAAVDREPHGVAQVVRIAVFEATERRRYEQELLVATEAAKAALQESEVAEQRSRTLVDTLQSTLIPGRLPVIVGCELEGAYRPAGDGTEVGGDFYDAFEVHGDCWIVLGDVSGKGVEAAVVTALVRNAARALVLSLLEHRREPGEIIRLLDQLVSHHDTQRFCTAVLMRLRRREGSWLLTYASGGHPPPLLRTADGATSFLEATGPPLGLLVDIEADLEVEQNERLLDAGDSVLLYTDGVTEARRGNELYGDVRLLQATSTARNAHEMVTTVLDDVLDFSDGSPRDDIACLALTVT